MGNWKTGRSKTGEGGGWSSISGIWEHPAILGAENSQDYEEQAELLVNMSRSFDKLLYLAALCI